MNHIVLTPIELFLIGGLIGLGMIGIWKLAFALGKTIQIFKYKLIRLLMICVIGYIAYLYFFAGK